MNVAVRGQATEAEIIELRRSLRRLRVGSDFLDLFGDPIPEDLLTDYPCEDVNRGLSREIQRKYSVRSKNIRRCWNRVEQYLPELMSHEAQKHNVLELSTAHGGMLEVLRHFGHDVVGTDYYNMLTVHGGQDTTIFRDVNDPEFTRFVDDFGQNIDADNTSEIVWPYKNIIESIGIPMALFDAGKTPYPLDEKQFDVVLCFQAIEHYCHPKHWLDLMDEFCRIARKSIVILVNPLNWRMVDNDEYVEAFNAAKLAMKKYDRNGFRCISTHMHWGEAAGFKFMATG